jgi:hypothetical protein
MAQTIETEEWITLKFSDPEYREAIMASGGYCQECDGQDMLGVHHVIYRSQGGECLHDNH